MQDKLPNGETVPGDSDTDEDEDMDEEEDEDDDQFEDADEEATAAAEGLLSLRQITKSDSVLGLTATRPKPSTFPYATTTVASSSANVVIPVVSKVDQLFEYTQGALKEVTLAATSETLQLPQNNGGKYYFHSSISNEQKFKAEELSLPVVSITRQVSTTKSSENLTTISLRDRPEPLSPPPLQHQAYLQEMAAIRARVQQEINVRSTQEEQNRLTSPIVFGGKTMVGSVEIIRSPPNAGTSAGHSRLPERLSSSSPTITLEKTTSKSPLQSKSPIPLPTVSSLGKASSSTTSIEVSKLIPQEVKNALPLNSYTPEKPQSTMQATSSIHDGNFAPRNVTMNVKDLPLTITRGKSPLSSSFNSQCQLLPKDLNTITQMKAASVASANFAKKEMPAMSISGVLNAISPKKTIKNEEHQPTTASPIVTTKTTTALRSNEDIMTTNADGKPTCAVCKKVFSKASQLRLHSNIHYMERPFRCEDCAVSFRTKGHLVKHERSAGHFNKVNINQTFGAPSSTNPRPFQCNDCCVKFRIPGHLAKHLRSKIHIMKLECTGKLPIGIFAEMERLRTNLNEIDTTNCSSALASLEVRKLTHSCQFKYFSSIC